MNQHDILRVFVIISMKRYLSLSAAYHLEWKDMGAKIDDWQLHRYRLADNITPNITKAERMMGNLDRLPPGLDDLPDDGFYSALQKKSLDIPVPQAEHVCPVTILKRHRPDFGHMGNGSYVEVQQDSERSFEATFVECTEGHHRPPCHGIDTLLYSSECVTLYEWRSAYVRLPGSNVNFTPAKVKIPIACQCRLTRKLQLFPRRLFNLMS